jgi:hypothetical protein
MSLQPEDMTTYVRKPTWMTQKTFRALLEKYGYTPYCAHCHENDPSQLCVDHIRPRADGGTDDISNLQWLCWLCNAQKGVRGDRYWEQWFYWDHDPNLSAFRTAQAREGYGRIVENADWFARPFSQISRRLYLFAWIVAAGKTLGIPAVMFALNYIIRRDCGSAIPRGDRILVLSKEQSNRDQMAEDLATKISGFGICPTAPRVFTITQGWQLENPIHLDEFDVVCACAQQLWQENGKPRDNLQQILAKFPVIFFDEPHFAMEQALYITERATTSLCFGFTGTPITATGDSLRSFVLVSLYDYDDANANDHSLKYLSDDANERSKFIEIIGIDEAEILSGEQTSTTTSAEGPWYPKNAAPAKSVAERVVSYVHDCDQEDLATAVLAPHRRGIGTPTLWYPMHAMIRAEGIKIGNALCDSLNEMFRQNRNRYPAEKGYRAELVCSESEEIKGAKLHPKHPWMWAKNNGGILSRNAARFLVVVGMGREGVDNPYCGVVGLACFVESVIEQAQRSLGRELRAPTRVSSQGELFVAPARLDTPKIILHRAFGGNIASIIRAIDILCNMGTCFSDIPTLEQLKTETIPAVLPDSEMETLLTEKDKITITCILGEHKIQEVPPPTEEIITCWGGTDKKRKQKVEEWIELIEEQPDKAWKTITRRKYGDRTDLPQADFVLRESTTTEPTEEDLVRFLRVHHKAQAKYATRLSEEAIGELVRALYTEHVNKFHAGELKPFTTLDKIRKEYGMKVIQELGQYFVGEKSEVFSCVGYAMRCLLGAKRPAANGTTWDIPQVHIVLTRPDIRHQLIGYVRAQLIYRGRCPAMAAALNIAADSAEEMPDVEETSSDLT